VPNVPYAWQKKDETLELDSAKSKSTNVLGFLKRDNTFRPYLIDGSVTSFIVVEVFEDFIQTLEPQRQTVIIIDNAPTHTSEYFQLYEERWNGRQVTLCHLSAYFPELNIIEILWRLIKYKWLPWRAYQSIETLMQELLKVLLNGGKKFTVSFA